MMGLKFSYNKLLRIRRRLSVIIGRLVKKINAHNDSCSEHTVNVLVDTGVWISYFGDRSKSKSNSKRIKIAKEIISFCGKPEIKLFYCSYIEDELGKYSGGRDNKIEEMIHIASKIPSFIGNDTWDEIDVNWEHIASRWSDANEAELDDLLRQKLPDKRNKSNRGDRRILLTAIQNENIHAILHENPKDFNQLSSISDVELINLLSISRIYSFSEKIEDIQKNRKAE